MPGVKAGVRQVYVSIKLYKKTEKNIQLLFLKKL